MGRVGQLWVFVSLCVVLIFLACLAQVRIAFFRLDSWLGVGRDGLRNGVPAPSKSLKDLSGLLHQIPSHQSWQVLVFADHSIAAFPSLVDGLKTFIGSQRETEVLLLPQVGVGKNAEKAAADFDLRLPVCPVTRGQYFDFNVRVMPFLLVIDDVGLVRASGLVNDSDTLFHLWSEAHLFDGTVSMMTQEV